MKGAAALLDSLKIEHNLHAQLVELVELRGHHESVPEYFAILGLLAFVILQKA